MDGHTRKLLTIVTEASLEAVIVEELERLGARGHTVTEARGRGTRGIREAQWNATGNVRIEVICDAKIAVAIARHLQQVYYDDYAMILFMSDIEVLRPEKF